MRFVLVIAVLVLVLAAWLVRTPRRDAPELGALTEVSTPLAADSSDANVVELGNPHEGKERARIPGAGANEPQIEFHVVDEATGADIEHFAVDLASSRDDSALRVERHARGRVVRTRVDDDRVKVAALGYKNAVALVRPDEGRGDVQTIRMQRAGGIQGVVQMAGVPLADAVVYQQLDSDAAAAAPARSYAAEVATLSRWWNAFAADKNGRFVIPDARPGLHALRFEAPGAASLIQRRVRITGDSVLDLGIVVLEREAIVRGVLVPPLDVPPSAFALDLDGAAVPKLIATDGAFELRGLSSGAHVIRWKRSDGHDASIDPELRRLDFVLAVGETRELVIDATGSGSFDLTVRVTLDGRPVERFEVRALPVQNVGRASSSVWSGRGVTDAKGVAVLRMKPGPTVFVEVFDREVRKVGRSTETFEMKAATSAECSLALAFGTVVVDLPYDTPRPQHGKIILELTDSGGTRFTESAATAPPVSDRSTQPRWTTSRVDFGVFPAGEYRARVFFTLGEDEIELGTEKISAADLKAEERLPKSVDTRIVVRANNQTLIVVP